MKVTESKGSHGDDHADLSTKFGDEGNLKRNETNSDVPWSDFAVSVALQGPAWRRPASSRRNTRKAPLSTWPKRWRTARTQHGRGMDAAWTQHGRSMDAAWTCIAWLLDRDALAFLQVPVVKRKLFWAMEKNNVISVYFSQTC